MEEHEYDETLVEAEEATPAPNGSLAARMAQRADQLEKHQSEWFGVPGYEDLVEVELRSLSWATTRKVQARNERIRDDATRELYNMADTIAHATMGFREVLPGGEYKPAEGDWVSIARGEALARKQPEPDDLTPRKAILYVCSDKRIQFLVMEFTRWSGSVRQDVDEEVVRDFERTGSPG